MEATHGDCRMSRLYRMAAKFQKRTTKIIEDGGANLKQWEE